MSTHNPMIAPLKTLAATVAGNRNPATPENPYLKAEALWFDVAEQAIDFWRDQRDMMFELMFHSAWGTPWMRMFGRTHETRRTLKSMSELRGLPEVTAALHNIERGGFVEAVIRMLILLAENRGTVRRDRLERSSRVLTQDEPFKSLTSEQRAIIIHEQTLIATYESERAIATLPLLLKTPDERQLAVRIVQYVPGAISEMSPHTLDLLQRFHAVLGLPPVTEDILVDPLEPAAPASPPAGNSGSARRRVAAASGAAK